jgi:hypothetical protein
MIFKKSKQLFYIIWLALGIFQLGDAAGAQLLSQEPNENNSSEISPTASMPVRISRSFFEKQTLKPITSVRLALSRIPASLHGMKTATTPPLLPTPSRLSTITSDALKSKNSLRCSFVSISKMMFQA